jgi:hypothetical protein
VPELNSFSLELLLADNPPMVRRKAGGSRDPIQEATLGALTNVMDQLVNLMFDTGITVKELNYLIRNRAVRAAHKRVAKEGGRKSNSRVAIMTGLPRSEIQKILGSVEDTPILPTGHHPAKRVLAAWYEDPRYLAPTGEPAILPIFGRRQSLEHLVGEYGAGIPVRAMLDELTLIGAVERLSDQRIRAKSRLPIVTGLTPNAIAASGERCADLLQTLIGNLHNPSVPQFEATALVLDADARMVPMVRRELAEQGASFINGAASFLKRSRTPPLLSTSHSKGRYRLGVSVFYFEQQNANGNDEPPPKAARRENLRRSRPIRTHKADKQSRR